MFMLQVFRGVFFGALPLVLSGAFAPATWAAPLPATVTLRNYFQTGTDSLTFTRPVLVKPYPAEDSAFIVLQQAGQVLTVRWTGGQWRRTDSAVVTVMGGSSGIDEQGLLGFAFHPNFVQNGKYYVYFVGGTSTVRYDVLAERIAGSSKRPATADPQRTLLRLRDPYDNHNAGTLGFDAEGHLLLGIGDGGTTQGDPQNRAQNKDSLHGKFLRFDVNGADAFPDDTTRNYAIPSTNPFKDSTGAKPEIWAYGARNPWKWALHPVTGEIWAGDVGQDNWEEITRVPKGANLGWRLREGPVCFNPSTGCPSEGILPPALSIPSPSTSSITGGVFFTGTPSSAYNGAYIFGDYGTHRIWAARVQDGNLIDTTVIGSLSKVVSFDRDRRGRILATSISPNTGFGISSNVGRVVVLESPDMQLDPTSVRPSRRPALRAITSADLMRHPEQYTVKSLDGRTLNVRQGAFHGMAWVRKKDVSETAQLLPLEW
jgi:glucose/arabinose dehydrogenase